MRRKKHAKQTRYYAKKRDSINAARRSKYIGKKAKQPPFVNVTKKVLKAWEDAIKWNEKNTKLQRVHKRKAQDYGVDYERICYPSLWQFDDGKCWFCKCNVDFCGARWHHLIMASRGGPYARWNLVPAHSRCHARNHFREMEFLRRKDRDLELERIRDRYFEQQALKRVQRLLEFDLNRGLIQYHSDLGFFLETGIPKYIDLSTGEIVNGVTFEDVAPFDIEDYIAKPDPTEDIREYIDILKSNVETDATQRFITNTTPSPLREWALSMSMPFHGDTQGMFPDENAEAERLQSMIDSNRRKQ